MNSIAVKDFSINFVRKNQKYLLLFVKIFITAALFFYIFSTLNFDEILSAAANADYYFLTFAFLLGFLNLFFQYWKWKTVCNSFFDEKERSKILFSLFYGFSAGIFTPGRIGEYFGRGIAFKDKSLIRVTAATFIDKIFPLSIVIFFGSFSAIFYLNNFYNFPYYFSLPIFLGIILLLYFLISTLVFNLSFNTKLPDAGHERESNIGFLFRLNKKIFQGEDKLSKQLQKLILNLSFLKKLSKKLSLKLLIISFLFYACFLIQFALLFTAFSQDLSFLKYFWIASLIMFVKTFIPLFSIGELGVREGTAIYFLLKIGGNTSTAFNASIFLFLINLLFPALIGLFFLYKKKQ